MCISVFISRATSQEMAATVSMNKVNLVVGLDKKGVTNLEAYKIEKITANNTTTLNRHWPRSNCAVSIYPAAGNYVENKKRIKRLL